MRPWLLPLLWAFGGLVGGAIAEVPVSDSSALYARVADARLNHSYEGVVSYQQSGHRINYSLRHKGNGSQVLEHMLVLNGPATEMYWNGVAVLCRFPNSEPMQLSPGKSLFPDSRWYLAGDWMPGLFYDVAAAGQERLAGRVAQKYMLIARDVWRYSYLWWLDAETDTLLKSVTTGRSGQVMEQMEFVSIHYNTGLSDSDFPDWPMQAVDSSAPPSELSDVSRVTWEAGWLPPGFMRVSESQQAASPSRGRRYSDGLATFSLFVEEGGEMMPQGSSRRGATLAFTQHIRLQPASRVLALTVVGEIPMETAVKLTDNIRLN